MYMNMYKTVRQGENSLQYHILPQDDAHVTSGHVMKRKRSSRNKTVLILLVTLILGCAIVAAAVLIPVLMAHNVVALPARFQTFAVAASAITMKGHGKYSLQGAQYIALLPVKDPSGHLSAYQLKPSALTSTTTTTTTPTPTTTMTTTTFTPSTTDSSPATAAEVFRIQLPQQLSVTEGRTENNDPHRPRDQGASFGPKRENHHRPSWKPDMYMPWMEHKGGALILSLCVVLVMMLASTSLGLCLYLRRRRLSARRESEKDKGTLLADVSEED